ncbi:thioesterase family protein [Aeromicrobium sp. CF3.5]|uniref:thioesterase family protein n=1 Tax=Aeromicrobium sp. CF3.5 TaxID=3373078 RepID=UPI003EE78C31
MRTSIAPAYDKATAVLLATQLTVDNTHVDGNSHVNVRHIYGHGVAGAEVLSEHAGIDDDYRARRSMGTFAAEHHIRYMAEIHQGALIGSRPLWIGRSERSAHMLVFITNETMRNVSAVLELLIVNMDLSTRKPLPFPAPVATKIDRGIAATSSLSLELPLSGAIGVRRT